MKNEKIMKMLISSKRIILSISYKTTHQKRWFMQEVTIMLIKLVTFLWIVYQKRKRYYLRILMIG